MEFEKDGHIDCFYVHHLFQKRGIASKLLDYVLSIAKEQNIFEIYLEASITAKPFFIKNGFIEIKQNIIKRDNQELINYSLKKAIN